MGTLMEEVSYEDDTDTREVESEHSRDRENLEISHLRHQNRLLEEQLRSNEESNERLNDDLESLKREYDLLRAKSERKKDQEDFDAYLRERNGYLEELYARTRVKYKSLKKSFKALQRDSCSNFTSFDQDFQESNDHEQTSVAQQSEADLNGSAETLSRLQTELSEIKKETSALAQKLTQEIKFKEEYRLKHEEAEARLVHLKGNLTKKENMLKDFQTETNCKIDEAIQYIKLIENEFHLDTIFPSDAKLTLEEKLDQFPTFIKKIYRDFVNWEFPNKRTTDVSQSIKVICSVAETTLLPSKETKQSILHGSPDIIPLGEKTDSSSKDDKNVPGPEVTRECDDNNAIINGENSVASDNSAITETPETSIFKQRKLGVRGLMRAVSHDPTRSKEKMLCLIFPLEIENMFSVCGTTPNL